MNEKKNNLINMYNKWYNSFFKDKNFTKIISIVFHFMKPRINYSWSFSIYSGILSFKNTLQIGLTNLQLG